MLYIVGIYRNTDGHRAQLPVIELRLGSREVAEFQDALVKPSSLRSSGNQTWKLHHLVG